MNETEITKCPNLAFLLERIPIDVTKEHILLIGSYSSIKKITIYITLDRDIIRR